MLLVSRRLISQHTNVTTGGWQANAPLTVRELRGKALGVVGLGAVGTKVARLAQAFGTLVVACRFRPDIAEISCTC
jgi:phosphoglycerate dehydrogenase-like enzyme